MIKDTCSALIKPSQSFILTYSGMCNGIDIFMKLLGAFILKLVSLLREHRGTEVVFVLKGFPNEDGAIKIEGQEWLRLTMLVICQTSQDKCL